MPTYRQRLKAVVAERGALCCGVDPHGALLDAWELPRSASGLEKLARGVVAALGEKVAVFKPQSAFFEVYGSEGIAVLERVLGDIRDAGALSILDVKRGDIGTTMAAYAEAYLAEDAPLAADAITISPYLGFGSLRPAIDLAVQHDRGVYVLARTSNPEGGDVQLALGREGSVAQEIIDAATELNASLPAKVVGLVVGGTHASLGCDVSEFNGSILVPGIGAQGGKVEDLPDLFGPALKQVLISVSREIIGAGPRAIDMQQRVDKLLNSWRSHER